MGVAGRYLSRMSVATLQQIGEDLPGWVALDAPASASQPVRWPDFAARRRAIFGEQVLPAGTAQALVNEDRGE